MHTPEDLPRYNRQQTYDWNFEQAPASVEIAVPAVPGRWSFCRLPVDSPLGVPAGPLLNGRWLLYYASLGFDVLTYKTVRSVERECYPLPNLLPVDTCPPDKRFASQAASRDDVPAGGESGDRRRKPPIGRLYGSESSLPASPSMQGSWAVSFGMPSKSPEFWRKDIENTRRQLPSGKVLSVSVVGTVQDGWTIDELADDYAQCARWAVESGADCVETNFSCPNVSTCDGQLYQQPDSAALVAERVRAAIGQVSYLIKVGHVTDRERAAALLEAVAGHADALAMTNSVATTVHSSDGEPFFDGEQRGICGEATREASIEQTRLFSQLIKARQLNVRLIGVGGAGTAEHVLRYLQAGAEGVHIATAAMVDPLVAVRIREEWPARVQQGTPAKPN